MSSEVNVTHERFSKNISNPLACEQAQLCELGKMFGGGAPSARRMVDRAAWVICFSQSDALSRSGF